MSRAAPNGKDCRHGCLKTIFPHPCPQSIPHYVLTKLNKKANFVLQKTLRLAKKLIKRGQRKTCFHYAEREVFSRRQKPSGLIARTELIMCCKTINNNFRNLSLLYLYPTNVHLRFVLLGAIRMVFVKRSVFCAKHS